MHICYYLHICINVYIYMYICMFIYIHTCTSVYTYVHIYVFMYTILKTYIYSYVYQWTSCDSCQRNCSRQSTYKFQFFSSTWSIVNCTCRIWSLWIHVPKIHRVAMQAVMEQRRKMSDWFGSNAPPRNEVCLCVCAYDIYSRILFLMGTVALCRICPTGLR